MDRYTPPASPLETYEQLVEFFDEAVLGAYIQQSDRYSVETDHFEGDLADIGFRMDPTVWRDREGFAHIVVWANFEHTEKTGDPLARLFAWAMGA